MLRTAIALTLLAAPLQAQDGPSFDCAKATSGAEQLICGDAALSALDRLVSARFAQAVDVARKTDSGTAESDLRSYQRGWIAGRDECWKADDPRDCVETSYLRREAELVAEWMLEAPTRTDFWTCGGNPANEVVTMYFETTQPGLRFERGDTIDTGVLTDTVSGQRYEGSFGRAITIDGEAAQYREPDPDGTAFDCVLRLTR